MTIHVGLDLSLTSTGVAVLAPGAAPQLTLVKTKPTGPTLKERLTRLESATDRIVSFVLNTAKALAEDPSFTGGSFRFYVEAPTYATNSGSQHDRSGLWWQVVDNLSAYGTVIEVSPTSVKAFATGKGNAGKPEMMAATAKRFPGVEFMSDDDSDALWIATLSEYVENPDAGRVERTAFRDKAASAVPRH